MTNVIDSIADPLSRCLEQVLSAEGLPPEIHRGAYHYVQLAALAQAYARLSLRAWTDVHGQLPNDAETREIIRMGVSAWNLIFLDERKKLEAGTEPLEQP